MVASSEISPRGIYFVTFGESEILGKSQISEKELRLSDQSELLRVLNGLTAFEGQIINLGLLAKTRFVTSKSYLTPILRAYFKEFKYV